MTPLEFFVLLILHRKLNYQAAVVDIISTLRRKWEASMKTEPKEIRYESGNGIPVAQDR